MKLLFLVSVFFAVALISMVSFANEVDEATLRQIASYRLWTKVNSEPVTINTEPIKLIPTLPKLALMDPALMQTAI